MLRYYKKKFDAIALMFLVCVFVLGVTLLIMSGYFLHNIHNQKKSQELKIRMEKEVVPQEDSKVDRYASMRDEYPDLAGFVTYHYYKKKVELPLMQTGDNDYYLYRDVEGKKSKAGTPFIDYRCDLENSLLLVLYAHNMRDLSQFGALKEYKKESYRKKYPYLYFESMYKKKTKYEVVAAFYSEIFPPEKKDVFRYYAYFGLENKAKYDYYIYNINRLAEYDTGIKPEYGEKLILLSTCDYTQRKEDGRFAVLAREVVEEDKSELEESVKPSKKPNVDDTLNNDSSKAPTGTAKPTKKVTATKRATSRPTKKPTKKPTKAPTKKPTKEPTVKPTKKPTKEPEKTSSPTSSPSSEPVTPTMPSL